MEIYHILIVSAIIFFIIEIFTASFISASIGVGLLCAAFANFVDYSTNWQIYAFSIGLAVSFFTIRPIFSKLAYNSDDKKSNQGAMIGRSAIVIEKISVHEDTGLIKLDGDVWKARTTDSKTINVGEEVEIVNINSIILIVKLKNK